MRALTSSLPPGWAPRHQSFRLLAGGRVGLPPSSEAVEEPQQKQARQTQARVCKIAGNPARAGTLAHAHTHSDVASPLLISKYMSDDDAGL